LTEGNGQTIVVSGGSRGLGQALVAALLASGNRVATFSRSETSFIRDCRSEDPDGSRFHWEAIDGLDFDGVRGFVSGVEDRFGGVDALINNAGVGVDGILSTMPDVDVHRVLALNLEAAIQLTRAALKSMLRRRSGTVLNITSINGLRGFSGVSVYSAAKAGLDGLTRSLAREVGPEGIRVNAVAPGYFESDMTSKLTDRQRAWIVRQTPLRRLGAVDDVVGVVQFLLSPDAKFISGQTIVVDGGLSC
jgi:3-oxoacyl-[acyl-carrier protein] reductase